MARALTELRNAIPLGKKSAEAVMAFFTRNISFSAEGRSIWQSLPEGNLCVGYLEDEINLTVVRLRRVEEQTNK